MIVENKPATTPEKLAAVDDILGDGPVCMVNLFKFRERAEYADGRETELSGFDAYQIYSQPTNGLISALGGRLYIGQPMGMVCGEVEDLWDILAIVEYPSYRSFVEMIESPEVKALQVHRLAGLEGQLNIATKTLG